MANREIENETLARHTAAMIRLRQIPGVVRVGFGLKEAGGQILQQWAYRVYVQYKRPLAELPVHEQIPPEIDGVKTDVLFADDIKPMTKTPSMSPGDTITRYIPNEFQASGTLGLIVRKGTDRFILTNQHVLGDNLDTETPQAQNVFDPRRKECAGIQCNNPIAHIIKNKGFDGNRDRGGKTYFVDATLAAVNAGVDGSNFIDGIGPLDQGLRDLSTIALSGTTPAEFINVSKRGSTTKLTQGRVIEMNHLNNDGTALLWEMRIEPTPGFDYQAEYELAPDEDPDLLVARFDRTVHATKATSSSGKPMIRLAGKVFCQSGDSGSIVVDDQRHIVGLLWASTVLRVHVIIDGRLDYELLPKGDGVICYIHAVFDALGIDPATTVIPPASPSAGVAVGQARAQVEDAWEPAQEATMRELEACVARTPMGRILLNLVSQHYRQIAHLVHHRRRVIVVWHRNHGPAYAVAFLRALRDPEGCLPAEINGVRLVEAIARFRDALLMEGDESLRGDLRACGDIVLRLASGASSIPELLRLLSEGV